MTKFQLKKIAFTLSLTAAMSAHAAGLGTMTSSSKLGEPLSAEIELLAVSPDQLNTIQATLASDQVYQDQSLEKPVSYPYLKIDVANNAKGQPVLKISSTQPITEAFLDMLIQVDWPTGRLVKEYTILLDPPGFSSNSVSEPTGLPVISNTERVVSPTATANTTVSKAPDSTSDGVANKKQPVKQVAQDVKPDLADFSQGIKTERGDTLYAIARQTKPDDVSVEQMLVALYKNNPQAFDGKNMNRLKVGQIIRVPDQSLLSKVGKKEASSLIAKQRTAWLDYKNSLAGIVMHSAGEDKIESHQQAAGKISSSTNSLTAKQPAKDVLKLSAGDEQSSTKSDKAQQAKQKANAAQEESVAQESAVKEQKARAAALEKQVADMKKLMAMKNDAMAQAEQNSKQSEKQPEVSVVQNAAQVEPEKTDMQSQAKKPVETGVNKQQPVLQTKIPAPAEQLSFLDTLMSQLKQRGPLFPLMVAALPLLLIIWLVLRVKRKKKIDNFEDVIVTSPSTEMQGNTVFGQTQSASGDTSFLTDFSQSGVSGMIDSHDVDPIAEAEVYMAYGRDAQAEEILKDAIQKDPKRQELKLKLLEIYQNAENKVGFESVASEVYAQLGPNDPVWDKVVGMGTKIDADNPLYQTGSSVRAELAPASVDATETEEAYHFNFEAPSLEIESANQLVSDAVPESDQTQSNAPEGFDGVDFELDQKTSDNLTPVTDSIMLDNDQSGTDAIEQPTNSALEFSNPNESIQAETVSPESNMTVKPLDLPSLNLEDDLGINEQQSLIPAGTSPNRSLALAEEDAVFESIPDLSLELGSSNEQNQSIESSAESTDSDLPDIDIDVPVESAEATTSSFDIDAIPEMSLELGAPTPLVDNADQNASEDESEEINTKLDLIQAYIDMEDKVGAKELIDEVLLEGGERQRQRANELLAKVAS